MAGFADYDGLVAAIASFVDRDDLAGLEPTFIELAEDEITGDIDHPYLTYRVTFNGSESVAVPADYRSSVAMTAVGARPVDFISQEDFDRLNEGGAEGYFCTIIGGRFWFASNLVGAPLALTYKRRLPALGQYNPSNWVLENYPGAYLYGALKAAAVYMIEDERVPLWARLYGAAIDRINRNGVDQMTPAATRLLKRKVV